MIPERAGNVNQPQPISPKQVFYPLSTSFSEWGLAYPLHSSTAYLYQGSQGGVGEGGSVKGKSNAKSVSLGPGGCHLCCPEEGS